MSEELEDEAAKKPSRAIIVRRVLVFGLALSCAAFWIWSRYLVVKSPLGGPCRWGVECQKEAPRCMRPDVDEAGICSRACTAPEDCAPGIRCIEVELDERDDKGSYLKEGTCVPQAYLDARKAKARGDAGAVPAKTEGWLEVPEGEGTLEAEITVRTTRPGQAPSEKSFLVKGGLVRASEAEGGKRRIVDTSSMRAFVVDDAKRTFTASVIGVGGAASDVTTTKTDAKDRVADRECEVWELADKRAKRTVCILHGGAFVDPAASTVGPWVKELAVRGALALRVVERGEGDREVSRTEVTRVASRPLERSLFAIPKSYRNAAGR